MSERNVSYTFFLLFSLLVYSDIIHDRVVFTYTFDETRCSHRVLFIGSASRKKGGGKKLDLLFWQNVKSK